MLAFICFWPLLGLSLTYAATINVIPSSDASIVYSPGWSQEFSQSTQDSFKQASDFGCHLSVTLPSNASSVSYVGFKRAGGSLYGYVLDCVDDCLLQIANGSDTTVIDDASVSQSTLFTLDMDPSIQHTLYVYNIMSDQPDGFSQINLNNLNVNIDVPDSQGPKTTQLSSDTASQPSSTSTDASSSSPASQSQSFKPPTTPSSSASSSASNSTSGSTAVLSPVGPVSSVSATGSTGTASLPSSTSGSEPSSTTVPPIALSPPTTGSGNSNFGSDSGSSNSNSGKTHGLSKSVAIGVSVLAIVLGGVLFAILFVFVRQRRKNRSNYASSSGSSQPPLSPAGSIIPIMPPPQMREVSATYAIPNPFLYSPTEPPPLDFRADSPMMQRRMEGRTTPATPPPSIPLPDIPRAGTDSRSDSPGSAYARNELWLTRSPARPAFTV
ncbi:hypothetical protein R3P38DRAFT_3250032 [Favolaschia claudopus]|uniref:Uncharacterized protein n=1 Tax=Favolaschia claudopus TaxID=2862362 RepID=A0AAW0EGA6_9AGAR